MRKTGTKVWARAFLPAIRELIEFYKGIYHSDSGTLACYRVHKNETCPLCVASEAYTFLSFPNSCDGCPWLILTRSKEMCTRQDYREQTVKVRLARLRRWERKLLKIINTKQSISQGEW